MPDHLIPSPEYIVFRPPSPNNEGIFLLHRSIFLVEGVNYPLAGRCDNLTYTVVYPTYGTEYEHEAVSVGAGSSSFTVPDPSTESGRQWFQFIEVPGKFCFVFVKFEKQDDDGNTVNDDTIVTGMNPGALWGAGSMAELFKILREWSLLTKTPFNSKHPMAIYSQMVFDVLKPPKTIIAEIDSFPDMHLSRFLKNDNGHRERVADFPQMSNEMQNWLKSKMEMYPKTTTRQKLASIEI